MYILFSCPLNNTTRELLRFKGVLNKIAFAGHGARCLLRLTFHLYDLAFSVFVFAKREHTY